MTAYFCRQQAVAEHRADPVPGLQRSVVPGLRDHGTVPDLVDAALRSTGKQLDTGTRAFLEPRFGHDFSAVRIHDDETAAVSARAVSARAYTVGHHVAFDTGEYRPQSEEGRRLLAHELAHVVQQEGRPAAMPIRVETDPAAERQAGEAARSLTSTHAMAVPVGRGRPAVQRAVRPEDVAAEMIGKRFTLTEDSGGLVAGDVVIVAAWSNAADTVQVTNPKLKAGPTAVPKRIIRPVRAAVAGVDPYSAGVEVQARAAGRNEQQLSDWLAKEPQYKNPRQKAEFATERTRIEGLLERRRATLNRRLIQETMLNRFDAAIKREVEAANTAHSLKGKDALDPNLLKSMLFQESQLGTSGAHLEVPPSHPVKTRFNLGQVIDSSAAALLTLFEREHPAVLTTYSLTTLRTDLARAQRDQKDLANKATRTAAEETRLTELNRLSRQNWETFIWQYRATGAPKGFNDAVTDFFAGAAPARNEDYEFWIHLAVLWLFQKRRAGMSWPEAIQAYNGSGARARHYRKAVVDRAASARKAAAKKSDFVPENL